MKSHSLAILCLLLNLLPHAGAEPLRTITEIQALSDGDAKSHLPVQIEAVVIYADPSKGDTVIHDGTAACFIFVPLHLAQPTGTASRPMIGDRVLFDGFTKLTGVTPHIEARSWEILGRGEIPEPRRLAA